VFREDQMAIEFADANELNACIRDMSQFSGIDEGEIVRKLQHYIFSLPA
jgi:hypothetical protein